MSSPARGDGFIFTPGPAATSVERPPAISNRDQAGIASGRGAWHPVRQRHRGRHAIGDDAAAVAGPFWAATEISPRCELPQPGAVGTHDIDIRQLQPLPSSVSEWHWIVAAGGEGNPMPF